MLNVYKVSRERYINLVDAAADINNAETVRDWLTQILMYLPKGNKDSCFVTSKQMDYKLAQPILTDYATLKNNTLAIKVKLQEPRKYLLVFEHMDGTTIFTVSTQSV